MWRYWIGFLLLLLLLPSPAVAEQSGWTFHKGLGGGLTLTWADGYGREGNFPQTNIGLGHRIGIDLIWRQESPDSRWGTEVATGFSHVRRVAKGDYIYKEYTNEPFESLEVPFSVGPFYRPTEAFVIHGFVGAYTAIGADIQLLAPLAGVGVEYEAFSLITSLRVMFQKSVLPFSRDDGYEHGYRSLSIIFSVLL